MANFLSRGLNFKTATKQYLKYSHTLYIKKENHHFICLIIILPLRCSSSSILLLSSPLTFNPQLRNNGHYLEMAPLHVLFFSLAWSTLINEVCFLDSSHVYIKLDVNFLSGMTQQSLKACYNYNKTSSGGKCFLHFFCLTLLFDITVHRMQCLLTFLFHHIIMIWY